MRSLTKKACPTFADPIQMPMASSDLSEQDTLPLRLGLSIVLAVTAWRVAMLAFNRTDLFLDEAQYWLWGQNLDFGYYSKPPVIAWVIRLFNFVSGSDATFWIRLPAPLFHMGTALVLMAIACRLGRKDIAGWVGAIFITLPAAALSSALMSTDTVQLLFVAVAIWTFLGLNRQSSVGEALLLGISLGLAFMTKYSVLFLLPGVGIAMLLLPSARISWRDCIIAAVAGALVVSPNLWWNLTHDITTVRHTESIAHWDGGSGKATLHPLGALAFFAAQFGVVGPLVFYAILQGGWRTVRGVGSAEEKLLAWLSLPVVLLITLQALVAKAYANWAVTAYAAGTVLAVWLLFRTKRGLRVSLIINMVATVVFPILTVFADDIRLPNGDLVMQRYVGRSDMSGHIADIAKEAQLTTIVADDRDILADLFYTLKGTPYRIYARNLGGFPTSYYEQNFSLPADASGDILFIATAPYECPAGRADLLKAWKPDFGYRRGRTTYAYRTTSACLAPNAATKSNDAVSSDD